LSAENQDRPGLTYAGAGVDTGAGDLAVELMKDAVAATHGPGVMGGIGAFAGLFDVSFLKDFERPLLATSTDGVGTKVAVAQAMDVHDTIGRDLVAMVVDDIVVTGARPLFMTDYIACGHVDPQRIADIVRGIADGCRLAGTALVGGETAEHPGLLGPEEYDVAGAAVGAVDADRVLGPERVTAGDVLLGLPASGLHSNGYSLARAAVARAGLAWDAHDEALGRTVGEEFLEPTRIYTADCLALIDDATVGAGVRAFSHVTGGGLAANLARIVPAELGATVDRSTWEPLPVFARVRDWGGVPQDDLERTLNMGIGMIAVLAPEVVDAARSLLAERGIEPVVLGEVVAPDRLPAEAPGQVRAVGGKGVDGGEVVVHGQHPGW
jgi:phosphoribosylformylglycinamidine cyclo-ligase